MKNISTLFILLSFSTISFSQTTVNGNQQGVWSLENSPYLVDGHITIQAGETLTIEAGVEVNFQGYYKFNVLGDLQAIGTEQAMILFTASNQGTGWAGLRVNSNDVIRLSYCRIEHGFSSGEYPDTHGGGMALIGSNAVVDNCIFADNSTDENGMGGAVYATGASALTSFSNSTFIRNYAYGEGGAIKFSGGQEVTVENNHFSENSCRYGGGAIAFYSTYAAMIKGNIFVDNYTLFDNGGAIQTLGFGTLLYLANNTFTENSAVTGDGGAINIVYADVYIANTIAYNNPGAYSDNVNVGIGGSAEIYYSNMPMPADATGHHNINVDPQFIDVENYDLGLLETSQCIDSGVAHLEANGTTLVNMNQFSGSAPDIGAKEYPSPIQIIFKNSFE